MAQVKHYAPAESYDENELVYVRRGDQLVYAHAFDARPTGILVFFEDGTRSIVGLADIARVEPK